MAKTMTRALRRHHTARLKQNRRFYYHCDLAGIPGALGKVVAAAASCSCWMCGNPRKHFNERSIQEQRDMQFIE